MNDFNKKSLWKARVVGKIISRLPFVRCVILNGSLANETSKESSDIDILIVAKPKRIFTARFFVISFATLIGIKRSKDESADHDGKFCFNYFLTENFLKIPIGRGEEIDQYCAENYSQSKLLAGDQNIFENFLTTNLPLFRKYGFNPRAMHEINKQNDHFGFKRIIEFLLSGKLGDVFEQLVKKWQIKKIESDRRTRLYPELIVYNDRELRFHPPKKSIKL